MLERIFVVGHVVIVVVGIGKEVVARGKHIGGTQIWGRQMCLRGILDGKHLFWIVGQILAQFVAQIGVGVPVTDDFNRGGSTDAAVVGGDDDFEMFLR